MKPFRPAFPFSWRSVAPIALMIAASTLFVAAFASSNLNRDSVDAYGTFTTDHLVATSTIQLNTATTNALSMTDGSKQFVSYAGTTLANDGSTTICTLAKDGTGNCNLAVAGGGTVGKVPVFQSQPPNNRLIGDSGITWSSGLSTDFANTQLTSVTDPATATAQTAATAHWITSSTNSLFSSTLQGTVPATGAPSGKFLRDDETWATPAGGVTSVSGTAPIVSTGGTTPVISVNTFDATHAGVVPASGGGSTNVLFANATWGAPSVNAPNAFYGTGIDGALVFDGAATILGVAPVANVYTMNRDIMATNITVNAGVKVFMANWAMSATATITDNGNINCNGTSATLAPSGGAAIAGIPTGRYIGSGGSGTQAAGGGRTSVPRGYFIAGTGGTTSSASGHAGAGDGGAGGDTTIIGGGVGRVGGSTTLYTDGLIAGVVDLYYGEAALSTGTPNSYTLRTLTFGGAAGGAGGGGASSGPAGAGGGMLWIAARTITGTGTIQARGGDGNITSFAGGSGGGGGGGGGMVELVYGTRGGSLTIDANGGAGGIGTNGCGNGGNGGSGVVSLTNLSGDGT